MIRQKDVYKIGLLHKPHGVAGELSFSFTDDSFDQDEVEYLILDMDGILVPFYIESYRFKGESTAIIKFEEVDTAEQARKFTNVAVFLPKHQAIVSEEISTWQYFLHFKVYNEQGEEIGEITHIDDATMNILFYINTPQGEILLPAHEELIVDIAHDTKKIFMQIPAGLMEEWEDE